MRAWTTSACVVLAWTLMLAALAAAGLTGSARPAPATTRTTHSTTHSTSIQHHSQHHAAAPDRTGGTHRTRRTGRTRGTGGTRGTGRTRGTWPHPRHRRHWPWPGRARRRAG